MSNKELQERNAELEAKVAELTEQLSKATEAATVVAKTTKGRSQALAALELLKKGPVSIEELKSLNEKYPSDPIYYVRTVLKIEVKTNRAKDGKTTYCLVTAEAAPEASEQTDASAETEQAEEVAAQ